MAYYNIRRGDENKSPFFIDDKKNNSFIIEGVIKAFYLNETKEGTKKDGGKFTIEKHYAIKFENGDVLNIPYYFRGAMYCGLLNSLSTTKVGDHIKINGAFSNGYKVFYVKVNGENSKWGFDMKTLPKAQKITIRGKESFDYTDLNEKVGQYLIANGLFSNNASNSTSNSKDEEIVNIEDIPF